jgi:hypothetical protein
MKDEKSWLPAQLVIEAEIHEPECFEINASPAEER